MVLREAFNHTSSCSPLVPRCTTFTDFIFPPDLSGVVQDEWQDTQDLGVWDILQIMQLGNVFYEQDMIRTNFSIIRRIVLFLRIARRSASWNIREGVRLSGIAVKINATDYKAQG
jgi:hypothetical protein